MSGEKISDRKYGVSENLVIAPEVRVRKATECVGTMNSVGPLAQAPVNDVPVPASAYARTGPEIAANPPKLHKPTPIIVTAALEMNREADAAIAKYNETRTSYAEGYMDAYSGAWAFVLGCLTEDEGRLYAQLRDAEEGGAQYTRSPIHAEGPAMTPREQLAEQLERDADSGDFGPEGAMGPMRQAAAELRKVCATCASWNDGKGQQVGTHWSNGSGCEAGILARFMNDRGGIGPAKLYMPADGSGFCHRHTQEDK